MKKLITLILLILGFVGKTSAASNVYLFGSFENPWNANNTSYPFTKVEDNSGNHFRILINSEWVTNDPFYFRFKVDGTEWGVSEDTEVEHDDDKDAYSGHTGGAFYIPVIQNAGSKLVYLQIDYYNKNNTGDKWHIRYYTRDAVEYVINFTKDNSDWGNTLKLYAWDSNGVQLNGAYPGKNISRVGETNEYTYTLRVPSDGADLMIFNDGDGGHRIPAENADPSGLTAQNNAVYSTSGGPTGVKVTISDAGIGTFSSAIKVTPALGVTAKYITGIGDKNVLTTSDVSVIPESTGVLIEGDAGTYTFNKSEDTGTNASSNKLVAVVNTTAVSQTDGSGNKNYILTKKTVNGTVATPMFFLVNSAGNTVTGGHAYLQLPTSGGGEAREYFYLWDETESIDNPLLTVDSSQTVYDLQGRRVQQPVKGLYIVDGKKVIK